MRDLREGQCRVRRGDRRGVRRGGSRGQRDLHPERRPPAGRGVQADPALVGCHDCGHDRQPEPGTAARARGCARSPPGRSVRRRGAACSAVRPGPWSRTSSTAQPRLHARPAELDRRPGAGCAVPRWRRGWPPPGAAGPRRRSPRPDVGPATAPQPDQADPPRSGPGRGRRARRRRPGRRGRPGRCRPGRCSSSRASSSRSSTRPPIRVASSSIRRIVRGDLAPACAPRPAGTARRTRGSRPAGCAARARRPRRTGGSGPPRPPGPGTRCSIWASMPFSDAVSRPTSVLRRAGRDPPGQVARRDRRGGVLDLDQRHERPADRHPAEQRAQATIDQQPDEHHDQLHLGHRLVDGRRSGSATARCPRPARCSPRSTGNAITRQRCRHRTSMVNGPCAWRPGPGSRVTAGKSGVRGRLACRPWRRRVADSRAVVPANVHGEVARHDRRGRPRRRRRSCSPWLIAGRRARRPAGRPAAAGRRPA